MMIKQFRAWDVENKMMLPPIEDLRDFYLECNLDDETKRITSFKIIGNKYENEDLYKKYMKEVGYDVC